MESYRKNNYFGETIKKLRKDNKMTQDRLALLLGVTKTTISNYETGFSTPSKNTLFRLAELFSVSVDKLWNVTEGIDDENLNQSMSEESKVLLKSDKIVIPVYSVIKNNNFSDDDLNIIDTIVLSKNMLENGKYFAYKMIGDSMELSNIKNGDYVVVRKQNYADNGDIAVVLVNNEQTYIRKYYAELNHVTLIADTSNKSIQPLFLDILSCSVRVLGRAVKTVSSL